MKLLISAVAALALALTPVAASAHRYHHQAHHHRVEHYAHSHRVWRHYRAYGHRYRSERRSGEDQGFGFNAGPLFGFHSDRHGFGFHVGPLGIESHGGVVGGRPRGCPYAFCGCGTSLYLFGHIVPSLNLAANWLHFPHVPFYDAAPGDAAVAPSRHHVLALVRHVRGPYWFVHDSNSGRHLTRDHVRNLAGYTVVQPRG